MSETPKDIGQKKLTKAELMDLANYLYSRYEAKKKHVVYDKGSSVSKSNGGK